MLSHVQQMTEAASRIGHTDLSARVPITARNDEVGNLALTLNHMLDRIEISMHQLHTITDSLAHDLRSPLTAIRGKLEMSLSSGPPSYHSEQIVSAIEELDRLTDFLNKSSMLPSQSRCAAAHPCPCGPGRIAESDDRSV